MTLSSHKHHLAEVDPEIAQAIGREVERQAETLELIADTQLPVFAIGGLQPGDLQRVRDQGGYGLAAIRGFWDAV